MRRQRRPLLLFVALILAALALSGLVAYSVRRLVFAGAHVPAPAAASETPRPILPLPPKLTRPPELRVWLAEASAEPELQSTGPCLLRPLGADGTGEIVLSLGPVRVRLDKATIVLGKRRYERKLLELLPRDKTVLKVDGKPYPGRLRLLHLGKRLAVINCLDIETYLVGVLGGEMPQSWPLDALKAQAVAARTYALYYRRTRGKMAWDLTSTVEDQVYHGHRPSRRIRKAVWATRGQVLLHRGRLFPAFFHSTCGGGTESPAKALGRAGFAFLEGVPCPYCRDSKYYTWSAKITAREMCRRLKAAGIEVGAPVGGVRSLMSGGATPRVVRVTWAEGAVDVPVADFRRAVGRMTVPSGKFQCRSQDGNFVLTGRGLGHGAGMCQYGARGMAKQGKSYRQVLAHYYRNTELKKLY